jgi:hypothetical protein
LLFVCALSAGCFGGPISDFPQAEGAKPVGGESTDHGTRDPDYLGPDAPPPPLDTSNGHGPLADAGVGLGGGEPVLGGDGDGDGVDPNGEEHESPRSDQCGLFAADGSCQGALCGVAPDELVGMVTPGGACVTDLGELALVCDETLSRAVGKCTQGAVLSGELEGVQECAASDPALDAASDDCVACYVQDNRCMLESCLLDCVLSAAEQACALCRQTHCAEAFASCSGLPAIPPPMVPEAEP